MSLSDDGEPRAGERRNGDGVLPAGAAGDSLEALVAERYSRTPIVYLAILGVVAIGCVAIPLVQVPVAVRAAGMIRPSVEKLEIRAGVSGVVQQVLMSEGRVVGAGEPLLRLSVPGESAHLSYLLERRRELTSAIADLERLASSEGRGHSDGWLPALASHRAELRSEQSAAAERATRIERLGRELNRAEQLLAHGLISVAESEALRSKLKEAEAAEARLEAESQARWARELGDHRSRLRDLDREIALLRADARLTLLAAPMGGSLEEVRPVAPGSHVTAGERLATLSPDAPLQVEAYLTARNVVLVRPGDPALIRIDGYDPAEWGRIPGRVAEIGADHVMAAGRPVFRLVIDMQSDRLRRKDGRIGTLRKGMPVEARIVVARPSLLALLRRSFTDWVRPRSTSG